MPQLPCGVEHVIGYLYFKGTVSKLDVDWVGSKRQYFDNASERVRVCVCVWHG